MPEGPNVTIINTPVPACIILLTKCTVGNIGPTNPEEPIMMLTAKSTLATALALMILLPESAPTDSPEAFLSDRGAAWIRHTIDDCSRGADGVRLADVNGDGLPDVTTGWEEGAKIRVYLNPGRARVKQKWPMVTVGSVASPEDAVFVDLDADGATDVVSCCEGRVRSMWVHWAPEDPKRYLDPAGWKTEPIPAVQGKGQWMFCLPLQVDGKHGVDLVAGSKGNGAEIGWLEAPPNPRDLDAWNWHPLYQAGWIMSLAAVDMDRDGDLDVLASDRKGRRRGCLWLENPRPDGDPRAAWREHRIGPGEQEVMFLDPVDLDRDGLLDVLVAVRANELFYYRRNRLSPASWESFRIQLPPGTGTGKSVRVGDMDADGRLDIVFSCERASRTSGVLWLSYRESVKDRTWQAHEISGRERGVKYDLVQLLDLDGDGDLDVLTCEESDNLGVIWYENPLHP